MENGTFNGVTLQKDPRVKLVYLQKFYEALTERVRTRMLTDSEKSLFDKINFDKKSHFLTKCSCAKSLAVTVASVLWRG